MHLALVVEDDPASQRILRMMLEDKGFRVVLVDTGERGERAARRQRPDVILVDLSLPDMDGRKLIQKIRAWCSVPIFVLSARTAEAERLTAFEAGADDYLTKPFSVPELLARLRAALRRHARGPTPGAILDFAMLTIDLANRIAHQRSGSEVRLTPLEYRILESLHRHEGQTVSHGDLIAEVWGPGRVEMRSLRVLITALRKKLEVDPAQPVHLITAPGFGYRLVVNPAVDTEDGGSDD